MTVKDIAKDRDSLTMTITAEFAASPARVWQLWADPRQLERWWGPPACPATVVDHDLSPGGRVTYFMRLPDGSVSRGWWNVLRAEEPTLIEFEDGFADEAGNPNPEMPVVSGCVAFEAQGANATRMIVRTQFPSAEAMDRLVAMGMEQGMTEALGQIDAILADEAAA